MPRLRSTPFAAALLLAAASGCTAFMPDPALDPAPVATRDEAPPVVTASAAAASPPGADASAAGMPSPGPAKAKRREGTGSSPPTVSSPARAPGHAAAAVQAPTAPPTAAASGGERPGTEAAGPSVTTFVFSDAPVPVRRGAAGGTAVPAPTAARIPEGFNPYRIAYAPGTYRCELGRSVQVRTVAADLRSTVLRWGEGDYTMRSVDARSGALRYEDPAAGLAWIVLKDRAMLLDTRAGQRLANACRAHG